MPVTWHRITVNGYEQSAAILVVLVMPGVSCCHQLTSAISLTMHVAQLVAHIRHGGLIAQRFHLPHRLHAMNTLRCNMGGICCAVFDCKPLCSAGLWKKPATRSTSPPWQLSIGSATGVQDSKTTWSSKRTCGRTQAHSTLGTPSACRLMYVYRLHRTLRGIIIYHDALESLTI